MHVCAHSRSVLPQCVNVTDLCESEPHRCDDAGGQELWNYVLTLRHLCIDICAALNTESVHKLLLQYHGCVWHILAQMH